MMSGYSSRSLKVPEAGGYVVDLDDGGGRRRSGVSSCAHDGAGYVWRRWNVPLTRILTATAKVYVQFVHKHRYI